VACQVLPELELVPVLVLVLVPVLVSRSWRFTRRIPNELDLGLGR
jgi:uncharacterized membrane protein YjgN (DUF898 family)